MGEVGPKCSHRAEADVSDEQDDICRAHPQRCDEPCPRCSYIPTKAPDWAVYKATFAVNGTRYRIVSVGSTNRYSNGLHFEDTVLAERIDSTHWELPAAPCPTSDIKSALDDLFALPRFRASDLASALRLVD